MTYRSPKSDKWNVQVVSVALDGQHTNVNEWTIKYEDIAISVEGVTVAIDEDHVRFIPMGLVRSVDFKRVKTEEQA